MAHIATPAAIRRFKAQPSLLSRLRAMIDSFLLYRRTIEELEALTDRELRDLGLDRLRIRKVAHETVYGR